MWQCHYCRLPLSLEVRLKNRLCPGCGSDIHCCRNCHHFNEKLASKCEEPNTPWVSDRAGQNDCEFFEFRSHSTARQAAATAESDEATSEAERAKEAFKALFRTA